MYHRACHDVKDGHVKILIKLLSLGVDLNARDYGGRTPLHICHGPGHNKVTLKMAGLLIRAGANIHAKDRVGRTPLHTCGISSNLDLVQLLLDNGADPHIKNNDGHSVYDCSPPSVLDLLGKSDQRRALVERKLSKEAVGGSFRQCGVCRVAEKVMKRCTGMRQ